MSNCRILYTIDKTGYSHRIMPLSTWCCDELKYIENDWKSDISFVLTTESWYNLKTRDWQKTSEPYPALSYKVPGYYGEVNTDYLKINNCPFCGSLIKIQVVE